jgi:NAD(P)H-quinone oxidoreductase subunit 5
MSQNQIALIALISPLLFIATAIFSWFQSGSRPTMLKQMSLIVGLLGIGTAVISGYFVFQQGLIQSSLIGLNNFGLSIRLDAISITMLTMIALLAFIVLKFSNNYMDGDERQGSFMGRLAATIASVQLLVISGNLGLLFIAWVFTSISLHRLLLFYPERPGAIIAARKKFILARIGDASLLVAIALLYNQFGSGNLEVIFSELKTNVYSINVEIAAFCLVLAALFKSAQFPTHGWLIEVMETPTPVSALLHAGLLNAGPYLIVRMAFVMDASIYAPLLLIAVGGFTALFASVVFLTQSSIKTALGYSSVAHMGFSLMVCGLGVYPAAMLHLVAHSFYKAHAFLSTGSVIDGIRASKIAKAERIGSPIRIAIGIMLALLVYSIFAFAWGINPESEFGLLALGAVIILGISRIFTSAIDSNGSVGLFIRATFFAVIVTTAFFSLESGMHYVLGTQIPALSPPSMATIILTSTILLLFTAAVFVQIIAPTLNPSPKFNALAIHLRNGLYMNAAFDKLVGTYHINLKPNDAQVQKEPKNTELESEVELVPIRK